MSYAGHRKLKIAPSTTTYSYCEYPRKEQWLRIVLDDATAKRQYGMKLRRNVADHISYHHIYACYSSRDMRP